MGICYKFEEKVSAALNSCPPDTVFLAAVSGGADSIAMLAILCNIKLNSPLYCLHVEHGLRPAEESCGDAEFVINFCKNNNIECHVESIPPGKIAAYAQEKGIGIEAAARFFRHEALLREAIRLDNTKQKTIILLAHIKDDLLENILMRVLRGVGPAGLAIMPQKRGRLFRPLLSFNRSDIINYLKAKNIPWREDSTNTDTKFLRNRIRHNLIPLLTQSFPSWKSSLHVMAETQALAADFIDNEAKARIKWDINQKSSHPSNRKVRNTETQRSQSKKNENYLYTDKDNFFDQPFIIREEAIFQGINAINNHAFMLSNKTRIKSIKRSVIRKFCMGNMNTAVLGSVKVFCEKERIILSFVHEEFFECGFSQLIN